MILSSCDIGSRLEESIKDFEHMMDFSLVKHYEYPNLWSLNEMVNQNKAK
jgi:hypothetical protein